MQATNLVINSIELGEDDAVDEPWIVLARVVCQCLVKLLQLVHGLIANQRLAHKQHQIRGVELDQLQATDDDDVGSLDKILLSW